MADIEITVDSGTSTRLLTAGKYCDKNILVTATGGGAEPEPPDDGKTRLYITVPANAMPNLPPPRNQVPLYIQQTVDRGVTIDWGDGSEPETLPGTGKVNTTHTYEQAGDYVISLDPAEGCELGLGTGSITSNIVGVSWNGTSIYNSFIKKAIISNVPNIFAAFYGCFSISSVKMLNGPEDLKSNAFKGCSSLSSVVMYESTKEIGSSVFEGCSSLTSLSIPASVTSIGSNTFKNCYGVKEYHILPETPPSLSSATALEGIPSDCIIYVPVGSLEAYQTATNWSTYADQMQEEPA